MSHWCKNLWETLNNTLWLHINKIRHVIMSHPSAQQGRVITHYTKCHRWLFIARNYAPLTKNCDFWKASLIFLIALILFIFNRFKQFLQINTAKTTNFKKIWTLFSWLQWFSRCINLKSCRVSFGGYCIAFMKCRPIHSF